MRFIIKKMCFNSIKLIGVIYFFKRTDRFAVSWILAVLSCVWWAMSSGSPAAYLFGSGAKPTTRESSRHGHRRRKMNTRIYPEEVLD